MPTHLPADDIARAESAILFAQEARKKHRRRKRRSSEQRRLDLDAALKRIKDSMGPLRSEIGRFPYGPQTDEAEANRERIRQVSRALQTERRKLWKMRKVTKEAAA